VISIVDKRRNTILKAYEFGFVEFENQFPTAFEFYRRAKNIVKSE
jgi:hypothetical protein